jgi:hypothetical protein
VGVFFSFTPLVSLHTVLALLVAFVFRLSKIAAAAGVWVNNPYTMPFVFYGCLRLGEWLLGIRVPPPAFERWTLETVLTAAVPYAAPLFLGTTIVGLVSAAIAYGIVYRIAVRVKSARQQRSTRAPGRYAARKGGTSVKPYSVSFGGIADKYSSWKNSSFAVIPFPIDLTTTYMTGARNGPRAILEASSHMELFDEENKIEPYRAGIFTTPEIPMMTTGPLSMLKQVERRVRAVVMPASSPSSWAGSIRDLRRGGGARKSTKLTVLQFARTPTEDSYLGTPWNHACVGRGSWTPAQARPVGIRSMSEEEDAS